MSHFKATFKVIPRFVATYLTQLSLIVRMILSLTMKKKQSVHMDLFFENFTAILRVKFLNANKETLNSLGSLVVSKLELSVTPTGRVKDLIVGNWAVLKVTPAEPEFFDDFKLSHLS